MNKTEFTSQFDELLNITRSSFDTFLATAETVLREQRPLPLAVDEAAAPADLLQLDMALLAAAPVAAAAPSTADACPRAAHRAIVNGCI